MLTQHLLLLVLLCNDPIFCEDFCAHEFFSPECPHGGTIVMEEAHFGRMGTGKCIETEINSVSKNDPKYFGCKADVLDILDLKCSGLQKCRVQVIDPEFLKRSNCYKELMQYLSVKYTCLPVYRSEKYCTVSLSESSTYLSFETFDVTGPGKCGNPGRPWVLETSAGQNVDLAVITFGRSGETPKERDQQFSGCRNKSDSTFVVKVTESNDRVYDVCSSGERHEHLMVSRTNRIEIEASGKQNLKFLVKAAATGCYDLKPPQDAWMKREGNEITVGCYMNRHTWKLFCNGRNWVGVIGNCTQQTSEILELKDNSSQEDKRSSNETGFVFLLSVGLSLAILMVLALTCGFMIHCQKSRSSKFQGSGMYDESTNRPLNVAINGDLQAFHGKEANGKLESSYQDPGYYVLENDNDREFQEDKKN